MNRLLLIRHAEAIRPTEGADFDRPLTDRGQADAIAQGQWLTARVAPPARVLCSPARRTLDTAAAMGLTVSHREPAIYEATAGELITLLAPHAAASTVALIGHNPGLSELAGFLAGRALHLQPGTVALLTFDPPPRGPLQPGTAEVTRFRHPRDPY